MMRNHLPPAVPGTDAQRISAYAGIVASAAAELLRQGYAIISFSADIISPGLPTLQVAPNRRTAQAVAAGQAADYRSDTLSGYPKRWWLLLDPPPRRARHLD